MKKYYDSPHILVEALIQESSYALCSDIGNGIVDLDPSNEDTATASQIFGN
ncbi:MAG: hypothetical protein PHV07_04205 [Oscillospiraceae bacterium]|nr:hypothetical protein [Oscillospiraceae bacterium]